jgi:hypothetical protein
MQWLRLVLVASTKAPARGRTLLLVCRDDPVPMKIL